MPQISRDQVNLDPIVATTGSDANSFIANADYLVPTNAVANTMSALPVPYAGMIEVQSSPDRAFVWQRYAAYNTYQNNIWTRSRYQGTWTAWKRSVTSANFFDIATASATTNPSGTAETDITGLSLTVPIDGPSDVFMITAVYDCQTYVASPGTLVCRVYVNGIAQPSQAIWTAGSTALRTMISQQYRITNYSAGNRIIKATMQNGVTGAYRVNTLHSTLTVEQK